MLPTRVAFRPGAPSAARKSFYNKLAPAVRPRTDFAGARFSGPPIESGTQPGRGDATMMKRFTPPIVITIALLLLIAIATLVRLRMGW